MNDYDLFKKLTSLHLSEEERRFMRQNVILNARERGILSPFTSFFFFSRSFVTMTALALMLIVGTTIVHSAEDSIPGDILYGMKRGVNERVLGVFAVSSDSKARLETKFVGRRLEEIQKIILEDKDKEDMENLVTTDIKQYVSLSVSPETLAIVESLTEEAREHAKTAEVHINDVSDSGDQDQALALASELELSIDVHASTIATLTQVDAENETLIALAATVQVLFDSGEDVSELGDFIAKAITEDISTFDKEKVEVRLAEAGKLLGLYKVEILGDELEDFTATKMLELSETDEISVEEIQESVVAEDYGDGEISVMTTSMPAELSSEEIQGARVVTEIEVAPVDAVASDPAFIAGTATFYILPSIDEIEKLIKMCKIHLDIGEYSQAYILCTEALQNISTLVEVRVKEQEITDNSLSSGESTVGISRNEEIKIDESIISKDSIKEKASGSTSILTGKVLNAFDAQVRN